ncbi:MAG: hypothetical protein LVQ95_02965, partial [Candidatus Micrarchaeales archaeon]|nr:hypothetical protein [Candidatus Micrarchaeales archaeon]
EQIASPYITVGKSGGATQSTTSTGGSTTTSTTTTSTSTTTVVGTFISGGNSGALPVSAVLSGSFSSYICAAGADASTLPNYIVDVNDSWGPNVSVLGHGTSYCTIADNPALASKYGTLTAALATVGLTNAPAPTIYNKPLWPGESGGVGSINYSITQPNSFVIITAACGYGWGCSGYTFPSGCTQRQSITDSNGDIAVVATCQSQASGKYYAYFSSTTQLVTCSYCKAGVEYPLGSILGASMAAYVYANYTPTGS